ncbi:universal stress protein [Pectinatus haikarae]|uniref:Nucleotide-binding universal stress UspA family protein n=1 Tax=Pectinatus haikarae TaxID=349096 RepID=A0ABT9YAU6_9FIRM|nr:universal stress protein [Pectinatus haikarae]MDQ0204932.1 nucleotide-binding universal stress UspA family protein [Pectinatus haikarae]
MCAFQKFLVPVDGSAAADRAAAKAAEFAGMTGAHIDLIYIAELRNGPMPQHIIRREDMPADVIEALKKTGDDILERVYQKLPSEIQNRTVLHTEAGDPKEIILEMAQIFKTDLIVMGTRGLNPEQAIMIGSVSRYLIECAVCPVMIVH